MIGRSAVRIFRTHVAGPEERAAECRPGERLTLAREPGEGVGRVRVMRASGEPVGYLPRQWLRRVARRMARGWRYVAVAVLWLVAR